MATKDLKINPTTGDLAIEGNDFVLVDEDDMTIQHMRSRLLLHRGEWPLDTTDGIPWIQYFQAKPFKTQHAQSAIRAELEDVDGVARIDDLLIVPDQETRRATISFSYTLDSQAVGVLTETI